jgi:hypothetical protein
VRDNVVQNFSWTLIFSISLSPRLRRSFLLAVLRKVLHEFPCAGDCFNVVLEHVMRDTRDFAVHLCTT